MVKSQIALIMTLFFVSQTFAQQDNSAQYVAQYAMQTVKSKNFKDLAENLFSSPFERKEVLVFLKKHDLLKRSLPDVIADGSQIIIKERKRNTTLDLSQLPQMKLVFNNEVVPFTGKESFLDIYQKLTRIHSKKQAGIKFHFFISEAFAELPVLATVALASYAKASVIATLHDQSCPQNASLCEAQAKTLQKDIPGLVLKSCKSQSGHLSFSTDESFKGQVRNIQYNLELNPEENPTYVSWIKVTADKFRCEFTLGEGGFGTEYKSDCFDGKTNLNPKELSTSDFSLITNKKYADLINCCSSDACSKFLTTPVPRVQPLAGKKVSPAKALIKK